MSLASSTAAPVPTVSSDSAIASVTGQSLISHTSSSPSQLSESVAASPTSASSVGSGSSHSALPGRIPTKKPVLQPSLSVESTSSVQATKASSQPSSAMSHSGAKATESPAVSHQSSSTLPSIVRGHDVPLPSSDFSPSSRSASPSPSQSPSSKPSVNPSGSSKAPSSPSHSSQAAESSLSIPTHVIPQSNAASNAVSTHDSMTPIKANSTPSSLVSSVAPSSLASQDNTKTFVQTSSIPTPGPSHQNNTPSPPPVASGSPAGKANAPTATSTVTIHPETTLSKPVAIPTTDAKGRSTLSIPPVITSVGVSMEPNGSFVSVTHIIANPTGVWSIGDTTASKHGFLSNGGAVAGVFVVIGIVIATVGAIAGIILCKRRRRRRIRLSISRPLPMPDNPFENPRESPSPISMRYAASDSSNRNLVGSGIGVQQRTERSLLDDEFEDISAPVLAHATSSRAQQTTTHGGLAGVGAGEKGVSRPPLSAFAYQGPFSDYHTTKNNIASTSPVSRPPRVRPPSLTPSTPSIYPPSLPPTDEDSSTHDSHNPITPSTTEHISFPSLEKPVRPPRRRPVPAVPPRNPMRLAGDIQSKLAVRTDIAAQDAQTNPTIYEPLTPPASDGSTSPNRTSIINPFSDYNRYMSELPSPVEAKMRDNFYTRHKPGSVDLMRRTSVEWRQ